MIGWGSRRGRQTLRPVPLMKFFWFAIHALPCMGEGKHTGDPSSFLCCCCCCGGRFADTDGTHSDGGRKGKRDQVRERVPIFHKLLYHSSLLLTAWFGVSQEGGAPASSLCPGGEREPERGGV